MRDLLVTWCLIPCRVFTFGIGSGASTALVKALAQAGNGSAEFIKEGERMQPKVQKLSHGQYPNSLRKCMFFVNRL